MSTANIIAIDGPAASGKSTLGFLLAKELGYLFLDTGAMYRAVALAALRAKVDIEDQQAVSDLARSLVIDIRPASIDDGRHYDVLIDGEDVTWDIRSEEVDASVSLVSSYSRVRQAMGRRQREIGLRGKVVMAGRDIGTVVLPEADLKIYLGASAEERSRRRHLENLARRQVSNYGEVLAAMQERDRFDSRRELAPLAVAPGAVVIDSTGKSIQEMLGRLVELATKSKAGEEG